MKECCLNEPKSSWNRWEIVEIRPSHGLGWGWERKACFGIVKSKACKNVVHYRPKLNLSEKVRCGQNDVKIYVRWSWFNSNSFARILTTVMIKSNQNDSSIQIFESNDEKIGCSVIICEFSWIIAHINNHTIRDISPNVLSRNFLEKTYLHKSERSCSN